MCFGNPSTIAASTGKLVSGHLIHDGRTHSEADEYHAASSTQPVVNEDFNPVTIQPFCRLLSSPLQLHASVANDQSVCPLRVTHKNNHCARVLDRPHCRHTHKQQNFCVNIRQNLCVLPEKNLSDSSWRFLPVMRM